MGYLLSQQASPVYDEHLGLTALRSGLATLLDLYKEADLSASASSSATALARVDEFLSYNLLVQACDTLRTSGATEAVGWEKLLLLLRRALAATSPQRQGAGRPGHLPPQTRLALRAVVALATENHMAFLRLLRTPSSSSSTSGPGAVLLRCLLHRFLPPVRRRVLEVWSKTLFKKERMPLSELARLLGFDTAAQAKAFAALHGVAIVETTATTTGAGGGGSGSGLDAWGDDGEGKGSAGGDGGWIEPRTAGVSLPAVGQTYEERRRRQRALAPRQDRRVLPFLLLRMREGEKEDEALGERGGRLAALWDAMGACK